MDAFAVVDQMVTVYGSARSCGLLLYLFGGAGDGVGLMQHEADDPGDSRGRGE